MANRVRGRKRDLPELTSKETGDGAEGLSRAPHELPRRPPPTTKHGRATRARLVQAAVDEFLEQGYVRARVESITTRAEVGYGTFYRYFTSKADLIRHLAEDVYGELFRSVTLGSADPSPIGRAYANSLSFFQSVSANANELRVLDDAVGAEPQVAEYVLQLRDAYAHLRSEQMDTATYHPVADPYLIASLTIGWGVETARYWLRMSSSIGPRSAKRQLDLMARINAVINLAIADPDALQIPTAAIKEMMELE